jgi:hypothetical protein
MSSILNLPPERSLPRQRHAAARAQLERFATSRRERLHQRWRRTAVVLGLGLGLTVAGGAAAGTIYLTKGTVPTVNGTLDFRHAPDFISVGSSGIVVGYVPKQYLIPSPANTPINPLFGQVAPVYGPDLKKLVGHMYPGVGFVPLYKSPSSVACQPLTTFDGSGTTSSIPCPSVTDTVPNVVGMYTPTGAAELSRNGFTMSFENEHSQSVPAGHIVRTSPSAGAKASARTPVVVINSLGP